MDMAGGTGLWDESYLQVVFGHGRPQVMKPAVPAIHLKVENRETHALASAPIFLNRTKPLAIM